MGSILCLSIVSLSLQSERLTESTFNTLTRHLISMHTVAVLLDIIDMIIYLLVSICSEYNHNYRVKLCHFSHATIICAVTEVR